jgi:hypothetical protein
VSLKKSGLELVIGLTGSSALFIPSLPISIALLPFDRNGAYMRAGGSLCCTADRL